MSSDETTLDNWGFLKDYRRYRRELIEMAEAVYGITCDLLGSAPTRDQCYQLYWKRLYKHRLFKRMVMSKPHLWPLYYETFAQMLARYVLANHWTTISGVPCP